MDPKILAELTSHVKTNEQVSSSAESFLLIGYVGSGKTTLAGTIPSKRTLFNFFEPNGPAAIKRFKNAEYIEWLPKRLPTTIKPTPKGGAPDSKFTSKGADVFRAFETFFMKALDNGFYEQYDVIVLDSLTALQDAMLDDVLARDGRANFAPEQSDYGLVGFQLRNLLSTLLSIDRIIVACAHLAFEKDEDSSRMLHQPILVGKQKTKTPGIFSNVFICEAEAVGDTKKQYIRTIGDNKSIFNLKASTQFSWLPPKREITINNWADLDNEGLGKLFKEAETRTKGLSPTKSPGSSPATTTVKI